MKSKLSIHMFILLIVILFSAPCFATVEWDIRNTLKLETSPLDVAISRNGQFIYVLADKNNLHVYSSDGSLEEKIKLENHVDQIEAGPTEDLLLLSSKKNQTVQFLTLEFVKNINISGSPFKGLPEAPVAVVVFSEFQWVYCKKLLPLLEQVLDTYPEEVRIVFKNFPLKIHKFATKAAIAAMAANSQGRFWEFHDLLFDNFGQLNDQKIKEIATELGLNQEKFEKEKKNLKILAKVRRDFQDGRRAGVRGTPTIFVNGKKLKNRTLDGFKVLIDKELKKK